jgi:hypothetical protein
MSPSRRKFLRAGGPAAYLAVGLSLVGLLSGRPDVREQSGQTVERTNHAPLTDETADPAFTTLVVGERGGGGFHLGAQKPHQVWVRNATENARNVLVEVGANPDADP